MHPKGILSEERIEESSDENSEDSSEDAGLTRTTHGHAQLDISKSHTASDDEQQSSESDTSSSKSDPGSSTGSKRRATSLPKQISQPLPKRKKTNSASVKRIEASQYVPPRGYAPVSLETNGGVNSTAIFSNMEGKQVWHISAPATLSLTQIRSLDLEAALRGGTILEQKGTKYTMNPSVSDDATILVLDNADAAYLPTGLKVLRSFHIEEETNALNNSAEENGENNGTFDLNPDGMNGINSASQTFFATRSGQRKDPRRQPENLKARFIPFGVPTDRPSITAHQKARKSPEAMLHSTYQSSTQKASLDANSSMSSLEHDSEVEGTRPKSNTRYSSHLLSQTHTPSKTPEKARKGTDRASSKQGSQPQPPSSTTKPHKEKKKQRRDHDEEMEDIVEIPLSSAKTAHQSPVSANVLSTPVSSGKKKKRTVH